MPDNYLYLGLLAALFPQATFIHCRRDLRDIAVSCWMTNFRHIRWAANLDHIAAGSVRAEAHLVKSRPRKNALIRRMRVSPSAPSRSRLCYLRKTLRIFLQSSTMQVKQPASAFLECHFAFHWPRPQSVC